MELKFNVTGAQRKEMVSIISDTVHMKAVYKFMPTCAYVIDNMTVSKEGTLLWDERTSQETIDAVLAALTTAGFSYEGEKQEPEQPAADESGLTVSLPKEGFSDMALENLNHLLDAKGTLIKKALGIEALPLEITDERVSFPWFHRLWHLETVRLSVMDSMKRVCRIQAEAAYLSRLCLYYRICFTAYKIISHISVTFFLSCSVTRSFQKTTAKSP